MLWIVIKASRFIPESQAGQVLSGSGTSTSSSVFGRAEAVGLGWSSLAVGGLAAGARTGRWFGGRVTAQTPLLSCRYPKQDERAAIDKRDECDTIIVL